MPFRCLLFTALLFLPAASVGDIYRWTDADGQRHFSDRPPKKDTPRLRIRDPGQFGEIARPDLRVGERRALKRMQEDQRSRIHAREQSVRDAERQRRNARAARERCYRIKIDIDDYRSRLNAGCTAQQCRRYALRLNKSKSLLRQHCQ